MVLEVFGNILFYPGADHLKEFPSPEELKGRVLLSTKPPKEYLEAKVGTMKEGDADPHPGKGAADDAAWGKEVPDFQTEIQSAHKVSIYIFSVLLPSSFSSALCNQSVSWRQLYVCGSP
jgi:phosphatidylinositol phospholipase C delta